MKIQNNYNRLHSYVIIFLLTGLSFYNIKHFYYEWPLDILNALAYILLLTLYLVTASIVYLKLKNYNLVSDTFHIGDKMFHLERDKLKIRMNPFFFILMKDQKIVLISLFTSNEQYKTIKEMKLSIR